MINPPSFRARLGNHLDLLPSFIVFFVLILVLLPPAHADYQSGLDAYNAARYTTALDDWKAVVEQPPGEVNPAIYAETHYAIGMLYWLGQGVTKDYFEASKWLHKAAELGHAGAQGKLGFMYAEGLAVPKDYDEAFKWFSKSAKQGNVDGQYNLGIFYLNGWGTKQDETMAAQYLAAASAQGDEDAELVLQNLLPITPRHSGLDPESIFLTKAWILAQNPNYYTLQIIGLSELSRLEKLVQDHKNLSPFATYTLQQNDQPLYLLIQGVYPDVDTARKARAKFPATIQKPGKVWIRKFEKIQELIRAEEESS